MANSHAWMEVENKLFHLSTSLSFGKWLTSADDQFENRILDPLSEDCLESNEISLFMK